MLSTIERLQEIIEKGENVEVSSSILAVELEASECKLVELVEALGPWLTDIEKERRVKGTKLLSHVLKLLPKHLLSVEECTLLSAFFCDRLNDHYTVIPATLAGIAALSLMDNFPDSAPADILMSLQRNVVCQSLTVSHRHSFYSIFHNIFIKKRNKVLSNFASDFLFGLVSGMASEHDPRNLLYLFSFLPNILSQIPLKHLNEEAFSVLESYFPVDYNPISESDPVTREDLARSLEACLVSTNDLADMCFPLICEKLDSRLAVAQLDSLKLLISGLKRWGIDVVSGHIEELWQALQRVLVPGAEAEVSALAAEALVALLAAYSTAVLGDNDTRAFSFLLQSISSCTHSYLSDPGLSLFTPTLKLLSAVASVSSGTADFIIPKVLPQLNALLESACSASNKEIVLKGLHPLLESSVKYSSWKNDECKKSLEHTLPILKNLLSSSKTSGAAFFCLSAILTKTDEDMRIYILEFLKKLYPSEESKYTRDEAGKFLLVISEEYPAEVERSILSTFSIPDDYDSEKSKRFLKLLIWIMEAETLTLATVNLFLKFISETEEYAQRRGDAVSVLRDYVSEQRCERVVKILARSDFPHSLLQSYVVRPASIEETAVAASFLTCLVRSLSPQEQSQVMLDGLPLLMPRIHTGESLANDLVLLEGLLSGLQQTVEIPDALKLCQSLLEFSVSTHSDHARTSAARLLSVLINKSQKGDEVVTIVNMAESLISSASGEREASVRLCAWITKALVLRSDNLSSYWLEQLMNFTSDESVGLEAAHGVRLVLEESPFFSAENFSSIGLLYKQRVFEKIELLIPAERKPSKPAALALAFILKNSPLPLILGRLEKLERVMVHCLDDSDDTVSTAILEILSSLLEANIPELISFGEDLIPRCLTLATTSPFMMVRSQALNCINLYGGYKPEDILPYKKRVISELQKCLDDRKRLVRQAAVRARTRWFVL